MNIKTNPFKAVSFVESAVKKALDEAGYLIADVKYDGVRGNICVDNTANAQWLSRVSKTTTALGLVQLAALRDVTFGLLTFAGTFEVDSVLVHGVAPNDLV